MPRVLSAIAFVAVLACAACSSSTEPVDPALSGTTALRAANVFTWFSLGPGALHLQPTTVATNDSTAFACPRGGSFKNTIDASGATIQVSLIYVGCSVADSAGQLWTFTTLPKLSMTLTPVLTDSSLVTTSTLTGAFRVEADGVRGTCSIDNRMRVETSLTAPARVRVHQSGQVCGQSIDTTWTTTLTTN